MSDDAGKPGLFEELKRRSVFRAAALYAVVAWVLVQIGEATFEPLGLPEGSQRLLIILVALGFPVAVVLAWIFDITPEGIVRTPDDPAAEVAHLRTGRRIDFAVIGALLIVVGLMLWGSEEDSLRDEAPATAPRVDLPDLFPPENPPLPDKPSVVVLPFDNMSGDPEQEYFADGIAEDLTTDLSRHPQLFVIARNSAFTYKGKAVRIEDVGRELGVRYAVEGSVRKAGDRVRINAQLIDATSGLHLWSERYDRELADIFGLQDEIVAAILDSVGVEIEAEEMARARRKPTEDLSAYDAYMRGLYHSGFLTRRGNAEARRWFERAIELDPGYAEAHYGLAGNYAGEYMMAWDVDPGLLDRAEEQARRCLELDPSIPQCHVGLANAGLAGGNVADVIRHAERAIELAPSFFGGHFTLGMARLREGQPQRAIQSFQRANRLNPRGEANEGILAFAHFQAGREREAVAIWERVRAANPDIVPGRVLLASYYEAAGDHAQARVLVEEIRAVNPDLTVQQIADIAAVRALGPEHVSRIQENLRRAGLP
jgi:TolB-like protein/Flp pilus assembly protein TadD